MKRKPIDIVSDIINSLIKIPENEEYGISEMSKDTESHYNTIQDYVLLIHLIQSYCPKIAFNSAKNKITIHKISPKFGEFSPEDSIILYLFTHKIFEYSQAIELVNIKIPKFDCLKSPANIEELKKSKYIQVVSLENQIEKTRIFLKEYGMLKAHGLLASINRNMGEFIDNQYEDITEDAEAEIDTDNDLEVVGAVNKFQIKKDDEDRNRIVNGKRAVDKQEITLNQRQNLDNCENQIENARKPVNSVSSASLA